MLVVSGTKAVSVVEQLEQTLAASPWPVGDWRACSSLQGVLAFRRGRITTHRSRFGLSNVAIIGFAANA